MGLLGAGRCSFYAMQRLMGRGSYFCGPGDKGQCCLLKERYRGCTERGGLTELPGESTRLRNCSETGVKKRENSRMCRMTEESMRSTPVRLTLAPEGTEGGREGETGSPLGKRQENNCIFQFLGAVKLK